MLASDRQVGSLLPVVIQTSWELCVSDLSQKLMLTIFARCFCLFKLKTLGTGTTSPCQNNQSITSQIIETIAWEDIFGLVFKYLHFYPFHLYTPGICGYIQIFLRRDINDWVTLIPTEGHDDDETSFGFCGLVPRGKVTLSDIQMCKHTHWYTYGTTYFWNKTILSFKLKFARLYCNAKGNVL